MLIPYIIVIRTLGPLLLKKMAPQQRRYTNRPRSKCSFSVGEVHTFPSHWQLHQPHGTSALLARDLVSWGLPLPWRHLGCIGIDCSGRVGLISQEAIFCRFSRGFRPSDSSWAPGSMPAFQVQVSWTVSWEWLTQALSPPPSTSAPVPRSGSTLSQVSSHGISLLRN